MTTAWPLVGRDDELRRLTTALTSSSHSGAVLTGPAGVGKTRLAREVLAAAERRGMTTEWVVATESASGIPLGAFVHLLPASSDTSSDVLHLVRDLRTALTDRAGGTRPVVGVDDAHHLDHASASLVHQLATTGDAFVLATVRARTAGPDAVTSLWKSGLALRLEVGALDDHDVEQVLVSVLDGQVDGATLRQLYQLSGGNALFLREFLIAGLESGSLDHTDSVWRWRGEIVPGTRLQEVVEERLARLSPEEREVLEIVAVGEPLGLDTFEQLGVPIAVVDRLERAELLGVRRDVRRQQAWLAHPLHGEVLRASTPALRARWIRRTLAEAVEARGMHRRGDLLRVATWRLDAGAADRDLFVEAARHAEGAFDFQLAERFSTAAADAGGGREARSMLAAALRAQDRPAEADSVWAQLEAEGGDADWRTELALSRSTNLFYGLGRAADALRLLDAVEQDAPASRHDELVTQRAMFALYMGRPLDAIEISRAVLERPDAAAVDAAYATVASAAGWAIAGETRRAIDAVDRAFFDALAIPVVGTFLAGIMMMVRYLALMAAGRLQEAFDVADATYRQAVELNAHDGIAVFAAMMGQARLRQGDLPGAGARLVEATALLREQDRDGYLCWSLGSLAAAYAQQGDVRLAERLLEEADRSHRGDLRLLDVEVEIARAWVAEGRGQSGQAVEVLLSAAREAEAAGSMSFAAVALHEAVRLGAASRAADSLERVAARTDSPLFATFARHGSAAACQDGPGLDTVSVELEQFGALLYAAEAAAAACAAYRAAGRSGSAFASTDRAQTLLDRCRGAATPGLGLLEEPLPLTAREREIALLAARGMTSREIAERLFVSVRTVDNHLHRSYSKLGVANRAELANVIGRGRVDGRRTPALD